MATLAEVFAAADAAYAAQVAPWVEPLVADYPLTHAGGLWQGLWTHDTASLPTQNAQGEVLTRAPTVGGATPPDVDIPWPMEVRVTPLPMACRVASVEPPEAAEMTAWRAAVTLTVRYDDGSGGGSEGQSAVVRYERVESPDAPWMNLPWSPVMGGLEDGSLPLRSTDATTSL